ncbi:MAG TPA: AI-2E family transporter [Mycobacteriales bacterium]|nr:AI-2E family transporter [Mycobacteriales bacterium]
MDDKPAVDTDPVAKQVSEPVSDHTTKPVSDHTADPMVDQVAERVADRVVERVADPVAGPLADPVLDEALRHREAGVDEDNPFGRPGRPMSRRSPFRVGFAAALGAGLVYLLYQVMIGAQNALILILVAAFLSVGLNPTVARLERLGLRRGLAVTAVFLAFVVFLTVVGYAVVPPVVEQVTHFVQAVPGYVTDLEQNPTIRNLDARYHFIDNVQSFVSTQGARLGQTAASNIAGAAKALAGLFFDTLTVLILTLYFLSSFNSIKQTAYRSVPRSRRARVALLGDEILSRVGGYVAGAFVIALIAGTSSLIWLSVLGVPYPLALALIVTITDVIPLVGATIGALLVTAVSFFVSIPVGVATFIFFMVYQQLENYVIYPRVMKRSVDVNPAAAIVAVLVGGALLGMVGALLAVPVTAALQLIFHEVVMPRQDAG